MRYTGAMSNEIHLRGTDVLTYGELESEASGPLAAVMSIGADDDSPSLEFKGSVPNEDALSGNDDGRFARLVVADSHFGHQASDLLVAALHSTSLSQVEPALIVEPADDESATTLTSIWLDRQTGQVTVHWVGDSLALRLRSGEPPTLLVDADGTFVTPSTFTWVGTMRNRFTVEPGDVLVAFTDGVNECHYRQPRTSIQLADIQTTFENASDTESFVYDLGVLALAGVNGHPGGQDNIAIIAVEV